MKYLRKFIAMILGLVLFAAVVISIGMIYAVKNINVNLITYAEDYTDDLKEAKYTLSVFKGESILFVSEEDVAKVVKDSNYTLSKFEKIFPCTINVTLSERVETFALAVEGGYRLYDSNGKFLRKSTENANINDLSPNIEILGISEGQTENIAAIAGVFKTEFGCLRSIVTTITLDTREDVEGYSDKLVFKLRCGIEILIDDYTDGTDEKIAAVYSEFCKLNDRQKLCGVIRGYRVGGEDGLINADYSGYNT